MSQWGAFGSFLLVIVLGSAVTTVVTILVQRSSTPVSRAGSLDGVLFVVNTRRWQRVLLRTIGIIAAVIGLFGLLVAVTSSDDSEGVGSAIAGAVIALVGIFLIWGAHTRARSRLEVTDETIWVFRATGKPRPVAASELTRLSPIPSNNFGSYGGFVARSGRKRLFAAPRTMLGYAELIAYLQSRRPDLSIPPTAQPFA